MTSFASMVSTIKGDATCTTVASITLAIDTTLSHLESSISTVSSITAVVSMNSVATVSTIAVCAPSTNVSLFDHFLENRSTFRRSKHFKEYSLSIWCAHLKY
jgi:hypothetical protein